MLRNSTQKFKEKYHPSKVTRSISYTKTQAFASEPSVFSSKHRLITTKSTPKLENTRSRFTMTQPVRLGKQRDNKSDRQMTIYSSQQIQKQQIDNLIKRKGLDQSEVQCLKLGKLKKMSKNKIITRKAEQFIEELPKNELFFCCQCFHFVFQIEKRRHYPDCKDMLNLKATDINQIGVGRLSKINQLAKYTGTNTNQIQALFEHFLHNNIKELEKIQQPPSTEFYTLQEIIYAFCYTYRKLLMGSKYQQKTFFDCY